MAMLLGLAPGTPFGYLALALAVTGAGLGLVNPPITAAAIAGMPAEQAGVASAVISSARQIGSLLGVAVMGDLVTTGVSARLAAGQVTRPRSARRPTGRGRWRPDAAPIVALVGYLSTTARAPRVRRRGRAARIARGARGPTERAGSQAGRGLPGELGEQPSLSSAGSKDPRFQAPPRPRSQARVSRIVSVRGRQARPAATARAESTSLNAS